MKHAIARRLHLWLSVPLGIFITIICLSGAVLVLERGFEVGSRCFIKHEGQEPVSLESILNTVDRQLPDGSHITGVTSYDSPDKAYKVLINHHASGALWVNQYTGEIIGPYERPGIFKFASSAHRRMFDSSKARKGKSPAGKIFVGVTTIALVVILITGLIIWMPTSRKEWAIRLKIPVRHGLPAFLHGLHCAGGAYVTIILLICALTGLTWSFKWYNQGFYTILGSEVAKRSTHVTPAENFEAWSKAYAEVARENPGREIRIYQGEIDVVREGLGSQYDYDNYKYDESTGAITTVKPYSDQSRPTKIKGWINTLHFGTWGGWPIMVVYIIFALVGATLPLTGYYLWIRRMKHKKHSHNG